MDIKNKLLLIITFCFFSTFLINTQSDEDIIEATSTEKYWKRHFFDLCLMGGPSFGTSSYYNDDGYVVAIDIGGSIGISCGYQYGFTNKFAFGPGFSTFINKMSDTYYEDVYYTTTKHSIFSATKEPGTNRGVGAGLTLMLMLMFGDLKNKKIAFLFDIGGGLTGAIKFGLYVKGFVFKTGYTLAYFSYNRRYYTHHITFDLGYKFNWKNEFKGKTFKKTYKKK